MILFLLTLAALLIVMLIMSVGVMVGGRRLRGSCGGVPGTACSCSVGERRACERKAAAEGVARDDGHRRLDVLDEDTR